MADHPLHGHPPAGPAHGAGATVAPAGGRAAAPIPELAGTDDVSSVLDWFGAPSHAPADPPAQPGVGPGDPTERATGVTDEDRNRFGLLLDHAAERGLLDQREYELRLGELASATSVDQMRAIVTELPVFTLPPATTRAKRGTLGRTALTGSGTIPPAEGGGRSSPWLILVVVVVLVAAALVFVAVYANHIVNDRNSGLAPLRLAAGWLSGPRS